MNGYLLDSMVISERWKPAPDERVVYWTDTAEWFLPAPVIAEIQEGAEACASAARREEINGKLDALLQLYGGLVLDWDAETSRTWGRLKHSREVRSKPQPLWDSLIDALAVRHGAMVATRNWHDFRHATTFDPWTGLEHPPAEPAA